MNIIYFQTYRGTEQNAKEADPLNQVVDKQLSSVQQTLNSHVSPYSSWLVMSRLDTTRHLRCVKPCGLTSSTQPKCVYSCQYFLNII